MHQLMQWMMNFQGFCISRWNFFLVIRVPIPSIVWGEKLVRQVHFKENFISPYFCISLLSSPFHLSSPNWEVRYRVLEYDRWSCALVFMQPYFFVDKFPFFLDMECKWHNFILHVIWLCNKLIQQPIWLWDQRKTQIWYIFVFFPSLYLQQKWIPLWVIIIYGIYLYRKLVS